VIATTGEALEVTSSKRVRVEILVQEDGSLSVEKGSEPCSVESIRTGRAVILLQAEAKFPGRWLDGHAAADRSIETLDDIHRGLVTGGVGPIVPSRSGTEERWLPRCRTLSGADRSSATILTSNRDPVEWLALMADPLLAQSAIDRLKSAAYELVLEGESYRHRQKPGLEADGEHTSNPRGAAKARR
jgi:hypothetical protein